MSAEVRELAVRYGAAWAEHDLEAIMAMHTDDTVFHLHGGGEPAVGRAAVREAFATGMAQWPGIRFERSAVYIGADHFVTQYRMSATTPDGRRIVCDGADVFAVEEGLVARKDSYFDWAAIQQQLATDVGAAAAV
jgi:ketosteroid isomerase-like protein